MLDFTRLVELHEQSVKLARDSAAESIKLSHETLDLLGDPKRHPDDYWDSVFRDHLRLVEYLHQAITEADMIKPLARNADQGMELLIERYEKLPKEDFAMDGAVIRSANFHVHALDKIIYRITEIGHLVSYVVQIICNTVEAIEDEKLKPTRKVVDNLTNYYNRIKNGIRGRESVEEVLKNLLEESVEMWKEATNGKVGYYSYYDSCY